MTNTRNNPPTKCEICKVDFKKKPGRQTYLCPELCHTCLAKEKEFWRRHTT